MSIKMSFPRAASLFLLLGLLVAPVAIAQGGEGGDPFEINGDVDNDGMVGPTDIQHVINGALGLEEQGPEAVNRELRQYIVASPRVSLAPRPGAEGAPEAECSVVGAATNFERPNGRLLVRAGRGIVFRFDRNVEGVWHDNACGLLRTALSVEIRPIQPDADPEVEPENVEWRLIGRDDAGALRCGPAIGVANIGVRHLFVEPGDYVVRCTVVSRAIPENEIVPEGETPNFCGAARDLDVVLIHVRVVDREVNPDDINWEVDGNSATVGTRFGDRLVNGEGGGFEVP